ncbi:hypothetical protein EDC02_2985 [Micromonospora sp. Llam0]|uniref:hypothetical protein n=1 Tax=Micromonospora sp. Llam0 TaxID=2485143 RepID=UPI000FB7BAA9|nr:hypothetical protein [Micromonospora sp. Llam0]ROO61061.1 hypothetical protein EDC02_2985 [Micromonospora sp. Llam0]
MPAPTFLASFDSASAMLLATAAYLRGESFPALGRSTLLKPLVKATDLLPGRTREKAFIVGGLTEAVRAAKMGRIDVAEVSRWVTREYPQRRYPAVAVGSSSGALVHLWAALGVPWLPQTFFIPVAQRVHPDDPTTALRKGLKPGRALLDANPDIQLHHMHDANQDRLMVRALTYFRFKRRTLGAEYEAFLRDRLAPGGTIIIADCRKRWRTTAVGERQVFQHGAVGGATQNEFHRGGPRVAAYLHRYDSPVRQWVGPEPDSVSPEAEWGFAPELAEDIDRFAAENGYQVRRIVFDRPSAPSPMVADLYQWWYRQRRIPARRLLIESFIVLDPWWTLRTGSVPYWMTFTMDPSLHDVERYLDEREPYADIHLALFQNGVPDAVGWPPPERWQAVLDRATRSGRYLGRNLADFPCEMSLYARYDEALRAIPARYPMPGQLTLAQFDDFWRQSAGYPGVSWESLTPAG